MKTKGLSLAEAACRARPFEKYQAVVEAASRLVLADNFFVGADSYGLQLIRELDSTLAALEKEDV